MLVDLKTKRDHKYPVEIPQFLSEGECRYLVKLINGNANKAMKFPNYTKLFIKARHDCIEKIKKRIEVSFNLEKGCVDELVVFNKYNKDGYVDNHYDDNRKYTFMIYLNDGFINGATIFPRLNREVEPKMGKLVIIKCRFGIML